jgi:hypothetical protein
MSAYAKREFSKLRERSILTLQLLGCVAFAALLVATTWTVASFAFDHFVLH